jgi:hypothetical protein
MVAGDNGRILAEVQNLLRQGDHADVLIGRIGLIAAQGDPTGQTILALDAAAVLCRYLQTIPQPIEGEISLAERAFPLFLQAMFIAAPAVRAGKDVQVSYPQPIFPSGLGDNGSVTDEMRKAVANGDIERTERLMLGLHGTGADYRSLEVRTYDSISTSFHRDGHSLMCAARGFQLLDVVEWGERVPTIVHWLAPKVALPPNIPQPEWVQAVQAFAQTNSMERIRVRISAPKNANALPLRQLVLSDADTTQVCQGVFNTVIPGEASPRATASIIALAAADVMSQVNDGDRETFVRVAHGLLFASAIRLVFDQVQDTDALPLLYTSAAYINALYKQTIAEKHPAAAPLPATSAQIIGGGLIAPAQLDTLRAQLRGQDATGALTTVKRYLTLNHDPRALWAVIGLVAAETDGTDDQGHTLQIVQAASEEFIAWPRDLAATSTEIFLQVAIRAAAFGKRDTRLANS